MPYTDPGAVTTGTTITSAWGNAVRNAEQYLANPPSCRVYHSAAQSINTATVTALAMNSERFDTDTMHDTVTNNSRITIKTAGLYVVAGMAAFAANATGKRMFALRKNGSVLIAEQDAMTLTNGDGHALTVTTVYKFALNDYVELVAYQTSGGALNVFASDTGNNQYLCDFAATWIGLG